MNWVKTFFWMTILTVILVLVGSIFLVGYLPGAGGFVAGQAAFTVFVVALFNLVEPLGWHTGLVRLQDVMLGAGVSAAVADATANATGGAEGAAEGSGAGATRGAATAVCAGRIRLM